MKKILIMMAMLFSTVSLAACSSDDTVPEAGVWNEDIYVNESLGFQFQLPRHWQSFEGDELAEILGAGAEILSAMESDFANSEILEAMESNPLHDMYATNPFTGATAQVMFQRLPRSARRYSSEEALALMLEEMEEEMGDMNVNMRSGSTQIGHYEFYSADLSFEIAPGVEMDMQMYLHLEGRNASVIAFTGVNANDFEELLYFFNEPGADRIEIEEPELVEESDLIGTWAWNIDGEYLLIFNENGTGVRGYVVDSIDDIMDDLIEELGQALVDEFLNEYSEDELLETMLEELVEEFEWEIANEILYIDLPSVGSFGVANEEWHAFIEGDVLTIKSRQASELGYSYIRQ